MPRPQAANADHVALSLSYTRAARLRPLMFRLPRPSRRTWILVGLGLLWALSTDGLWQRLFSTDAPAWPQWLRGLALLLPAAMLGLILRQLCRTGQARPTRLALVPPSPPHELLRGLHDQLGHSLVMARLQVDQLLSHHPAEPQASSLARLSGHLNDALTWVRRTLGERSPAPPEGRSPQPTLPVALGGLIDATRPWPAGLEISLQTDTGAESVRWPPAVETAATMVAREALLNALRHAQASRIVLHLSGHERCLRLVAQDNGIGLPTPLERARPGHFGLSGMRDNAHAVGANLSLSCPAEGGTRIAFEWQA